MTTLDTSIVNVALPDMQRALGFTTDGLQWVVTAYLLVLGGFLMLSGRLGDVLSPLRLLRAGLAIFGSASAVGGVAGSPAVLVAARAGQGLGAAILVPTTLALITRLFTDPAERRRMLSWWSATGSFGFACGTVLGGVLVQWISWRAVLLVNVPLCAVAAIGTFRMPTARAVTGATSRRVRDVGVAGAMLVTSAATAWLFTLTWAPAHHWPSPGTAVAVGASVGLTGVLALQQRAARRRLATRRLLFTPGVLAANAVMFAFGIAATSGVWLVITLFLQHEPTTRRCARGGRSSRWH